MESLSNIVRQEIFPIDDEEENVFAFSVGLHEVKNYKRLSVFPEYAIKIEGDKPFSLIPALFNRDYAKTIVDGEFSEEVFKNLLEHNARIICVVETPVNQDVIFHSKENDFNTFEKVTEKRYYLIEAIDGRYRNSIPLFGMLKDNSFKEKLSNLNTILEGVDELTEF